MDGFQANCKACALLATQRWWEKQGKEEQQAYHGRWRVEHPGASKAASRRHYRSNPQREINRVIAWRKANQDWVKNYERVWMAINLKAAEYNRRRRARLRGALRIRFTTAQLTAKMAYWGNRCWVCGGPPNAVDHVKPLAKGGPHCLANLRPICTSCNSHKRSKWPYPLR